MPRRSQSINEYALGLAGDKQPKKYYLVAIPDGELAVKAKALQEEISELYKVYREPFPPLHLTVAVIAFPPAALVNITEQLAGFAKDFLPLKLSTLGAGCFPDPYKSIHLSVERTDELVRLSSTVFALLTGIGYSADSFNSWDYHISLVNRNYAAREWTEAEFEEACLHLSREQLVLTGTAKRLELWDPAFPPLNVLASFP